MSMRTFDHTEDLSTKQRLCLFHGSSVKAEDALLIDYKDLTFEVLLENGVRVQNITAAGIGPQRLKSMGLESADRLRSIGFDALYLADPRFASEANAAFGSEAIRESYLRSASDAVAISGTDAMGLLGITCLHLMEACAGAPTEAHAVLQQLPLGTSLSGVPASVVLDTGLRKAALMQLGYSLSSVVSQTSANARQLETLGFALFDR